MIHLANGTLTPKVLLMEAIQQLSQYHPIIIEGRGQSDQRNPDSVSRIIHQELLRHWSKNQTSSASSSSPSKPLLVVTQGDPPSEQGIAAITKRVAELLDAPRCVVCLDYLDGHGRNADRANVVLELQLTQLEQHLEKRDSLSMTHRTSNSTLDDIKQSIHQLWESKNKKAAAQGLPILSTSHKDFALLQEVTKAAAYSICGEISMIQTSRDVVEFSVTSFSEVGLNLRTIQEENVVPYPEDY